MRKPGRSLENEAAGRQEEFRQHAENGKSNANSSVSMTKSAHGSRRIAR